MANTPGAKKAIRKIERRTEVNKARRSRVRTFLRKFEEALSAGDVAAAGALAHPAPHHFQSHQDKGFPEPNTWLR